MIQQEIDSAIQQIASREIKFRVWRKPNGNMVEVEATDYEAGSEYFTDDNYILMQFTGLKDKNGKDVYEGDIIEKGRDKYIIEDFCEMFMSLGVLDNKKNRDISDYGNTKATFSDQWEVIGNIFENSNLLTK